MDQPVPHSDDIRLGNFRAFFDCFRRYMCSGLPYDFNIFDKDKDKPAICIEILTCVAFSKLHCFFGCVTHVVYANLVILFGHTEPRLFLLLLVESIGSNRLVSSCQPFDLKASKVRSPFLPGESDQPLPLTRIPPKCPHRFQVESHHVKQNRTMITSVSDYDDKIRQSCAWEWRYSFESVTENS